jgi:hypothetical protein
MVTVKDVDEAIYLALRILDRRVYKVERESVGEIVTYTFHKNGELMGRYQIMPRREDGAICFGSIDAPGADDYELNKEWDQVVEIIWGEMKRHFGERAQGFGMRGWVEQPATGKVFADTKEIKKIDHTRTLNDWTFDVLDALIAKHLNAGTGMLETTVTRNPINPALTIYGLNSTKLGREFAEIEVRNLSNKINELEYRVLLLPPLSPNRDEVNQERQGYLRITAEHLRSRLEGERQQLEFAREQFSKEQKAASGAAHAYILTAGRCKDPDRLLAEVQAMLTRHLNTELLYSGRIETSGEILGNEHRRHVISAEWRELGRLPIGYIELYPAGDDWYSFELARYGTLPEVGDASPAEDFFDGLLAQLENDYLRKAQARGSGTAENGEGEQDNNHGMRAGTSDRVKAAHELLKQGKISRRAAFKQAHTDSRTYNQYCKQITGEDPIEPYAE